MALITPQELIDYTTFKEVKERSEHLLKDDILEAQAEIFSITNGNKFDDTEKYPTVPEEVKLACKKMAQYFAMINSDLSELKGMKSEKIGDYSYQKDGLEIPDIHALLSDYILEKKKGNTFFRMRAF